MRQRFQLLVATTAILIVSGCAQIGMGLYRSDLNDDIIERVALGQSEAQVTALLNAPYRRVRFENLKLTAWDYRYRDTWGYWVDFSVMVGDTGLVTGKFTQRLDPIDNQ